MENLYREWIGLVDIGYLNDCKDVNYIMYRSETYYEAYWYDIEPYQKRIDTKQDYMERMLQQWRLTYQRTRGA